MNQIGAESHGTNQLLHRLGELAVGDAGCRSNYYYFFWETSEVDEIHMLAAALFDYFGILSNTPSGVLLFGVPVVQLEHVHAAGHLLEVVAVVPVVARLCVMLSGNGDEMTTTQAADVRPRLCSPCPETGPRIGAWPPACPSAQAGILIGGKYWVVREDLSPPPPSPPCHIPPTSVLMRPHERKR